MSTSLQGPGQRSNALRCASARGLAVLGLLVAAHACGGSTEPDPEGPTDAASLAAFCQAGCDRRARCDAESEPDDEGCSACLDEAPPAELLRHDFIEVLTECTENLACSQSDDSCTQRAITTVDPNFATSPLVSQCLETQDECGTFIDDTCIYAIAFTGPARTRFGECLSQRCDQVEGCLAQLLESAP